MHEKIVFLDRDGVINLDSEDFIKSPEEWQPIPNSLEAIALLNHAGFKVVIVTNQSGIGRGLFTLETLDAIHAKMRQLTTEKGGEIAGIYYCPDAPEAQCACRKPKPGLLQQFSQETNTPLQNLFFVGDAWRDIQTALVVGARPLLVKTGKGLQTLSEHPELTLPVFEDLYAAAKYIIAH
ncbi:MAG: D-glycero-beta-D-manno-heptose 1,7-bisphosphate 7-phosphatase [Methylococcales bacterium]